MASQAYTSFTGLMGAAIHGEGDAGCSAAARNLYLLAVQYAVAMVKKGYDEAPYPADRPQKLQIANEMLMRAELACHTQSSPKPGPPPPTPKPPAPPAPPSPVPASVGTSWALVGAAALAVYFLFFKRGVST